MKTSQLVVLALLTCATARADGLGGAWNVAKLIADGNPTPSEVATSLQLKITGSSYQLVQNGTALESGTLFTSADAIDLTIENGGDRGKTQHGRYKLDGDTLILTKFAAGQDGRPKDLDAKPGQTRIELTRVPPPVSAPR